jgi:hypothetical protein
VLVGDEFVVVSDLVLRWACWWRRWFADLIFTFVYFGGGEELRWCWRCSVLASPGSGFDGDCGAVVIDGDEVMVDVARLVFFDYRFSDNFSNLLRFAGLVLSSW